LLGGGRVHFVNPGEISGAIISRPVGIVEQREVTFRGATYGWAIPFLWGRRLDKVVENPGGDIVFIEEDGRNAHRN
jgi:hypothetical protein